MTSLTSLSLLGCQPPSERSASELISVVDVGAVSRERWFHNRSAELDVIAYQVGRLINAYAWVRSRAAIAGLSPDVPSWLQAQFDRAELCHPQQEANQIAARMVRLSYAFVPEGYDNTIRTAVRQAHRAWVQWFQSDDCDAWGEWISRDPDAAILQQWDSGFVAGTFLISQEFRKALSQPIQAALDLGRRIDQRIRPATIDRLEDYRHYASVPAGELGHDSLWIGDVCGLLQAVGFSSELCGQLEEYAANVHDLLGLEELDERLRLALQQGSEKRSAGDSASESGVIRGVYGLLVTPAARTIRREGRSTSVELARADAEWQIFRIVFDAQGSRVPYETFRTCYRAGELSGYRSVVHHLNKKLEPLGVRVNNRQLVPIDD